MMNFEKIHKIKGACVVDSTKHHPRKDLAHPTTKIPKEIWPKSHPK
jgi:hypothetical protein